MRRAFEKKKFVTQRGEEKILHVGSHGIPVQEDMKENEDYSPILEVIRLRRSDVGA